MPDRQKAVGRVRSRWDGYAERHFAFYTRYRPEDREDWRRLYQGALGTLLGPERGSLRVLDVGTGTGFVSVLLAELGHDVTGIDVSARMLGYAASEARHCGQEVRLLRCGAHDVPALGREFDVVTARNVVWTLPDPHAALAGWRRVMRPGGAVIVADGLWRTLPLCWGRAWGSFRRGGDRSYLPRLVRDYLGEGWRLPYWRGVTAAELTGLFERAGFSGIRRFDQLLGSSAHPVCAEFTVLGARAG